MHNFRLHHNPDTIALLFCDSQSDHRTGHCRTLHPSNPIRHSFFRNYCKPIVLLMAITPLEQYWELSLPIGPLGYWTLWSFTVQPSQRKSSLSKSTSSVLFRTFEWSAARIQARDAIPQHFAHPVAHAMNYCSIDMHYLSDTDHFLWHFSKSTYCSDHWSSHFSSFAAALRSPRWRNDTFFYLRKKLECQIPFFINQYLLFLIAWRPLRIKYTFPPCYVCTVVCEFALIVRIPALSDF